MARRSTLPSDPLARDQARLEGGRARLLAGGDETVIPGHGEPFRPE